MAPRRLPLPLGTKAGTGQSKLASSENLINLYAEANRGQAISPVTLLGIPGQTLFSTIGGTKRGQFKSGSTHFAVRGEQLYTVSTAGVAQARGTIEGTARCRFGFDGRYLHIVADAKSYTYELASSQFQEHDDVDFQRAVDVAVVSNIPVFARAGTGQIAWPDLNNTRSFGGLDFGEGETSPDELVGLHESAQELLLFSKETLEPWRFTGNPDQYFEPSGASLSHKVGALNRDTIAGLDNAPFWLATNQEGALYVARLENGPTCVSNHAVETSLEKASRPALNSSYATVEARGGHAFYVLTVPNWATWALDVSTNEWAQRLAGQWPLGTPEIPQGDWGVTDACVNAEGALILGKGDGNLYRSDPTSFSADGGGICREVTAPPFFAGGISFSISEIELICTTGVGLTSGASANPNVELSLSFDGGKNWSEPFQEELGPIGEGGWGVIFRRLGRCPGPKGLMARFRCVDPVEFTPQSAFITIDVD